MIDQLYRSVSGYLPDSVTPTMFAGSLVALVLLVPGALVGSLWWRRRQRNRFTYRFEIFWDKKLRPFCPTCRSPLSNWSQHSGWKFESQEGRTVRQPATYHAFDCPLCVKPVRLVDSDGYEVSLEEALAQLQAPVRED
ncbi:hypothetical protein DSOUD_1805 [Desulfuromonas soudanensis]|uniref:Uncharacterized protein n=1 Tax=Desulfuromonas soudanensis TaxID=1603606 RepID=A0A0M4D9G2_9BACT|nr:hypothetical protein [Desulfuromonas soudanensis]ALC16580.1 hypothetical protein DSOUD_1805 [Desulfuromonas soudanensis]